METEFIYETDLSAFAQAAAAGVQVPVSVASDGTQEVSSEEIQVHSSEVHTQEVLTGTDASGVCGLCKLIITALIVVRKNYYCTLHIANNWH